MDVTSTKAELVDRDFSDSVIATLPRAEFEAALASEEPAELFLEVASPASGDSGDVAIAWSRDDLEQLLSRESGPTVTLSFDRGELENALAADLEAHGLREKALILSVASAAAFGGASAAAAGVHEEAGLTARGVTPSYVSVYGPTALAERGIEPVAVASHDEATLTARGIEATPASAHDEATLASRGIDPVVAASHDEATLAARGIDPVVAASHDEATLAARGIDPVIAASHDEATLTARGITPAPAGEGTSVASGDGFVVDGTTAAAVGAGLAGLALAITAAGFARRREGTPHPV